MRQSAGRKIIPKEPQSGLKMPPSPSPFILTTSLTFTNVSIVDLNIFDIRNVVATMWMSVFENLEQNSFHKIPVHWCHKCKSPDLSGLFWILLQSGFYF